MQPHCWWRVKEAMTVYLERSGELCLCVPVLSFAIHVTFQERTACRDSFQDLQELFKICDPYNSLQRGVHPELCCFKRDLRW